MHCDEKGSLEPDHIYKKLTSCSDDLPLRLSAVIFDRTKKEMVGDCLRTVEKLGLTGIYIYMAGPNPYFRYTADTQELLLLSDTPSIRYTSINAI